MKTFSQFISEASYKSAEARALLDAIAGSESPGYDVIFRGQKFKDFSKHPEIDVPIPWKPGYTSNAAGRYQFLSTTYKPIAKELGLKDFSPDSQDRAAWRLAARTYGDENKLRQDLRRNPVGVASRLSGQWTSLPGGAERNAATDSFEKRFRANLSRYDKGGSQPLSGAAPKPAPAPKPSAKGALDTPAPTRVLAKEKGKTGELDLTTRKFTKRDWSNTEGSRYKSYGGK